MSSIHHLSETLGLRLDSGQINDMTSS